MTAGRRAHEPFEQRLDMTLREWAPLGQRAIMTATSWMGIQTRKNPLDAWIYQEILHDVRPDIVVEIGSWAGGSTLYFAHLLDLLGHGRVVSVDVDRSRFCVQHPRIDVVDGSSSDPAVVATVSRKCAGQTVLVCHDGDHTREQVALDLRTYAPLVTVGSYLIVEDSIVDFFERGGPLHPDKIDDGPTKAIEEFISSDRRFIVDVARERFGITWNPGGFLRRVA